MLSTARRRRPRRRDLGEDRPPSRSGPLRVAVLSGGVGHERPVSIVSGREVAAALRKAGHAVTSCVLNSDDEAALDAIPEGTDVVFIALHGDFGEDGTIQQLLARRGLCYTGSGPEPSARAYDKLRAKRLLRRAGIPLASHRVVEFPFSSRAVRHVVRMTEPGARVVVKPSRGGSSVGVSVCSTLSSLTRALEDGAAFRCDLLVEEFVPGHELTCGILDGRTLPVVEIVPLHGFYDYDAKYDAGCGTSYVVDPPRIPGEVRAEVQRLSLLAHETLGCEEMSRVDFRYDPEAGRIVFLEVNTIPGLTPTSLLPKAAAAVHLPFGALVDLLCRVALRSAVP